MGKTIKQLAEEFGVSKTAIRKRFTPEFKEQYLETNPDGSFQITDQGCELIAESLRKSQRTVQTEVAETSVNQGSQETIAANKETIAVLVEQLSSKDEQIKALMEQLVTKDEQIGSLTTSNAALTSTIQAMTEQQSHLTEALRAAQALHAGTIQERLTVQEQDEQTIIPEQPSEQEDETGLNPTPEKKKSWRERLGDWIAGRK